jgi:L-ascorbate metabolism protein UlaG (beta-lactamase superfamily)
VSLRLGGTIFVLSLLSAGVPGQETDTVRTAGSDIRILPIAHGTLGIVRGEHVILIDPARFVPGQPEVPRADLQAMATAYLAKFGAPPPPTPPDGEPVPELLVSAAPVRSDQIARFAGLKPPSLILITHTHTDHLDPRAIAALRTPETHVIVPTSARGMLLDVQGAQTMANGERRVLGDIVVEAAPMYNMEPDPTLGVIFHPRGRGNGYVISLAGTRLYVAGDSGCTPEMMGLKNIDVAFVPMNPPYTMSPAQAAECVRAMRPGIVYPYHYFGSGLAVFESALKGSGIEVRIRDWYAGTKDTSK